MESPFSGREPGKDTSMWTLAVRFSPRVLDIMAFSDLEAGSLTACSFPLVQSQEATPWLKAVEDTVYENPLILQPFRRTILLIEPEASMIVPSEITAESDLTAVAAATFPTEGREWRANTGIGRDKTVVYGFPEGLTRFISRTWGPDQSLQCHLSVLSRYFIQNVQRGKPERMLVNLREGSMDIIAVDRGTVRLANTFSFATPDDAVYYILAALEQSGLDRDAELLVAGHAATREAVMPLLRRFIPVVMPVIFPPRMFRAGRESVNLPFDLTVSPLCE